LRMQMLSVLFFLLFSSALCQSMYGVTDFKYVKIDLTSGAITDLQSLPTDWFPAETGAAVVDQKKGIYYQMGNTHETIMVIGFDITTGNVKYAIPVPIGGGIEDAGCYIGIDPDTGLLYVAGDTRTNHILISVDPTNNKTITLAAWKQGDAILGIGGSTYDSKNKIFWLNLLWDPGHEPGIPGIGIYGISVTLKKLIFQFNTTLQIETWNYNPATGLSYGVGLQTNPRVSRILLSLDGSNAKLNTVGTIPKYLIMDGSISTIDSDNGNVYVILNGALVSSSVTNAGVVNAVGLQCDVGFDCPLSIGYYKG